MMKSVLYFGIFLSLLSCQQELIEDQNLVENLLENYPNSFKSLLRDLDKYEIQIIYTQVNRDSLNRPEFKSFSFNVDEDRYFYPASTVKLPIALLALEKLHQLGIDKYTTLLTDSAYSGQQKVHVDSTAESGLPSVSHYIKKILVVSDNEAYNRLYEFLGQEYINRSLREKGFDQTRVLHRLSAPLSREENAHTNPVRFIQDDSMVYSQPLVNSRRHYHPLGSIWKGKAYTNHEDSLIDSPFDFTYKNFMPLEEMQMMLRDIVFPSPKATFSIPEEDYSFIHQYLSQLPRETSYPAYDSVEYYDAYCKFLIYGDQRRIDDNMRIFNKIGQAYGYLIDNAYIVDFETNVEFLLSAVIHVNENETYNDGVYEYDEIGFPFMRDLGQVILDYERNRTRKYEPDLSKFRMKYDR